MTCNPVLPFELLLWESLNYKDQLTCQYFRLHCRDLFFHVVVVLVAYLLLAFGHQYLNLGRWLSKNKVYNQCDQMLK